jgi:hypothetical protein
MSGMLLDGVDEEAKAVLDRQGRDYAREHYAGDTWKLVTSMP